MIRENRRRHHRTWVVLAGVLVIVLWLAWASRQPPPWMSALPPDLAPEVLP